MGMTQGDKKNVVRVSSTGIQSWMSIQNGLSPTFVWSATRSLEKPRCPRRDILPTFGANKQADRPGSGRVAPDQHRSLVYQSGPTANGSTIIDLRRLRPRDNLGPTGSPTTATRIDKRTNLVKVGISIAHLSLELVEVATEDTEDPHPHGNHGQVHLD